MSFPLAKMSPLIRMLTAFFLALPIVFAIGAFAGAQALGIPAVLVAVLCAWVWLRWRPSRFTVENGGFEIVWPLKRRRVAREEILSARVIDRAQLKVELGWAIRIGVGGLWGGFGRLWTKRRGLVRMYISRTDRFVWIETAQGGPWLITPESPEAFVQALSSS